jgi:hypothetical protein
MLGSWALLLAVLNGSPALAYWQVTPQAQVGITYESNPRYFTKAEEAQQLLVNPEAGDDALGVYLDAQLQGLFRTPSSQVTLTPRIRRTDYLKSNEDLNDADSYLNFTSTHRGTLGSVGLDAGYQKTGVRSSEFESATPSEPDAPLPENGGSGQFSDTTQKTWDLQPSLTFSFRRATRSPFPADFQRPPMTSAQPPARSTAGNSITAAHRSRSTCGTS